MKRIALLTVLLLVIGLASGFAQDPTPVTVTGSLGFGFGVPDFDASQPQKPQFDAYESTSATAKLMLSLVDDAITAGLTINLMALPKVTLTNPNFAPLYPADADPLDAFIGSGAFVNNWAIPYVSWLNLTGVADFWDAHYADTITTDDTKSVWTQADLDTAYALLHAYSATTHLGVLDAASLKTDIALFGFANADFGNATLAADITAVSTAFSNAVSTAVDHAIVNILAGASTAVKTAVTSQATLNTYLNTVTATLMGAWGADDRALLAQAADLMIAYIKGAAKADIIAASTLEVEGQFLSGANITFKKVAGVLDISYLFGGQHVGAGSLNADYSGHQADAVDAYSGLKLALASGLVPGVSAGLTFYATAPAESISDSWYTVLVDETAAVAEPTYGVAVNAGYSMDIMEGTSVGVDGAFAIYMSDPAVWAVSIMPSFSGFGATLGGEFAYGLGGLMVASANVSYSIMGITISPFFKYAANAGDYVVAYADPVTSVDAQVLNGGGTLFGANLSIDISKLVEMVPVTLTAGVTSGGADSTLEYNAGLSASMMGFTLAANVKSMPLLVADNMDYDVSLSYAYDKATLKLAYSNAYSASLERYVAGVGLTCALSF